MVILVTMGSGNCLSPVQRQAILRTNAVFVNWNQTNNQKMTRNEVFLFNKMLLKMSPAKLGSFYPDLNVLRCPTLGERYTGMGSHKWALHYWCSVGLRSGNPSPELTLNLIKLPWRARRLMHTNTYNSHERFALFTCIHKSSHYAKLTLLHREILWNSIGHFKMTHGDPFAILG